MNIRIAHDSDALGSAAARDIAAAIRLGLQHADTVRIIFAAAPSQSAMLRHLRTEPGIEWHRVIAFHMDEYIGLPMDAPQRFAHWLQQEFFAHVPVRAFHPMEPVDDPDAACLRYAKLLLLAPVDLVLLGIGTNAHLAFNDPPADLNDPATVKLVTLDRMCREQQVFDGCFPDLDAVPTQAMTLTVPALLAGRKLFCCIPGAHKRDAVRAMLHEPVSGLVPATALRTHSDCRVYLDESSAALIEAGAGQE